MENELYLTFKKEEKFKQRLEGAKVKDKTTNKSFIPWNAATFWYFIRLRIANGFAANKYIFALVFIDLEKHSF